MPGNPPNQHPRPVSIEDYDSDEGKTIPDIAKPANKPANVRPVKVSQATPATKVRVNVGPDTASDSGYSSRTAATMNSADSAKELRGQTPKKETKKTKKVVVQEKPLPQVVDERREGRDSTARQQRSPTKAAPRSASQNRKSQHVQTNDPNYPAVRQSSQQASPLESGMDINYPPFNEQHRRSSQNYGAHPAPQNPTAAFGQARPRANSASRVRRQSYYEGAPLEAYYDPSYPNEHRGPPPSQSAYSNIERYYPYRGHTTSNAGFYPPTATTIAPSSLHPRPEQPSARRPDSNIYEAPPLVTYGPPGPVTGPSARRQDPYPPQVSYDSELGFYDTDEEDIDRIRMPPPSSFPSRQSSLHHSPYATPPTIPDYHPDGYFDDSRGPAIHRSSSARRPPLLPRAGSSGPSRSSAYSNTSNLARITTVESSAPASRRYSFAAGSGSGYDDAASAADLDRANRHRRAQLADRQAAAEYYQARHRAAAPPAEYMQDTVRSTETLRPGLARTRSKAGSERSTKTAGSGSSRTSMQPDGSVRLRVDASKGIEFSGDMEGRTIGVVPGKGGMAEVTIRAAAGGGRETVYGGSKSSGGSGSRGLRSERGRKVGRVDGL